MTSIDDTLPPGETSNFCTLPFSSEVTLISGIFPSGVLLDLRGAPCAC